MTVKMELAISAWPPQEGWCCETLCSQAELAESLGFHSFWLPENHFNDQRSIPSPLTLLAAVAGRTQRIGLASTSYLLPIRDPILAAEEVAVLDQLSGGRVILGVGRGIQPAMFKVFGIDERDKRKLFQQKLELMLSAWRGEAICQDEEGNAICLAPLPVQRPHPPVWVAAFGPLALAQVGKLGLPYLASPIESLSALRENYRLHGKSVSEANVGPVATVPVMRAIFITEKPALANTVRASLGRSFPRAAGDGSVSVDDWAIVGDTAYVRDCLSEYAAQLGITHLIAGGSAKGAEDRDRLLSHERLLEIVDGININSP